jgi:hypothetical protein
VMCFGGHLTTPVPRGPNQGAGDLTLFGFAALALVAANGRNRVAVGRQRNCP